MAKEARYDVFLSHNSADKPAVEALARRLVQAGVQPWLDTWNLIPGEPFQEAIEEALDRCATCAIFVGPSGTGPWQNEEMRAAIQRRVEERCGGERPFRVIPVLLPGAERGQRSRLPSFLVATTWVEFRRTLDDEAAFHRLVCGIRGLAPGPAPGEAVYAGECPYRGLRFFDVQHAPFFFGREALTEWLLNELRGDNRFLAVVGPSGSGKSSLARAGLVAALERGEIEGSETWPIAICRPGPDPLESLAVALGNVPGVAQTPSAIRDLMRDLREDERMLHLTARLALRDGPPERRLALLMDQFEELFTLCHDEDLRQALVDNLLYAASAAEGQAVVLLTLRADFYGKCAVYPRLADALSEHQVLVGPMTDDELERAIERPAQLAGCEFEPGLVERLLDDVRDQPGGLPLLQHALLELWGRREVRRLTHGAYEAIGEVEGALEKRAEAVYHRLTEAEQEICRRIFLRLTQPGEGTEDTKRRATLQELWPAQGERESVEVVVQTLAGEEARLVTTEGGEALEGECFVEVAHEALIRGWSRLREWIEEDRDSLRMHRQVTEAAQEWQQGDQDESFLHRGARLAAIDEWAGAHADELNALERDFVGASVAAREGMEQAARRRRRSTIGLLSTGLTLITVLAIVATALGTRAGRQADELAVALVEAEHLRTIAESRALAAYAENVMDEDPQLAVLLGLEAVYRMHRNVPGTMTAEACSALHRATARSRWQVTLHSGHTGSVGHTAWSSDDARIVTASGDGSAKVWDAATGAKLFSLNGHSGSVYHAAWSSDDTRIVTASDDGSAKVWDAATRAELLSLSGHSDRVLHAAWSSDDTRIVTASADGSARVWDAATGAEIFTLRGHSDAVVHAAWSSDDTRIVTASSDGSAKVWDATTGAELFSLSGYRDAVVHAAWSSDDTRIVTASGDGSARV